MDHGAIWETALEELALQMTRDTFSAWLATTRVLPSENGALEIGVPSKMAQDWLTHRLGEVIHRTVATVAGEPTEIVFKIVEVPPESPPQDDEGETVERAGPGPGWLAEVAVFDPACRGWTPYSNYAALFWAPLLGRVAWPLYLRVRTDDRRRGEQKKADLWTPARRYYAPKLGREVGCGKQAITGVWRKCEPDHEHALRCDEAGWSSFVAEYVEIGDRPPPLDGEYRRRQAGALERLAVEDAGRYDQQGEAPHVFYLVRVRVTLPLLTPEQVSRLPAALVTRHDRWIWDHTAFDPLRWKIRG